MTVIEPNNNEMSLIKSPEKKKKVYRSYKLGMMRSNFA